jgi:hypothetical protein
VSPPILRSAAAADVEEAWLWYETQREGLGDEFLRIGLAYRALGVRDADEIIW